MVHLTTLFLFSFGCAALSAFIDKCFERGMIFRGYYVMIKLILNHPKKKIADPIKRHVALGLFKVSGGCIYCFSTWLFVVFFLLLIGKNWYKTPEIIGLFLGIGINYISIEIINRIRY